MVLLHVFALVVPPTGLEPQLSPTGLEPQLWRERPIYWVLHLILRQVIHGKNRQSDLKAIRMVVLISNQSQTKKIRRGLFYCVHISTEYFDSLGMISEFQCIVRFSFKII